MVWGGHGTIEHSTHTANAPHRSPAIRAARGTAQFGLRGLIWFMVACSVYFAQLAFVLKAGGVEESLTLPNMATVAIGWLLLAIYYLRIHFRLALIVHCAGLGTNLLIVVLMSPLWLFASDSILLRALDIVRILLIGGLVGSLTSLPTTMVLMIARASRRNRPEFT